MAKVDGSFQGKGIDYFMAVDRQLEKDSKAKEKFMKKAVEYYRNLSFKRTQSASVPKKSNNADNAC